MLANKLRAAAASEKLTQPNSSDAFSAAAEKLEQSHVDNAFTKELSQEKDDPNNAEHPRMLSIVDKLRSVGSITTPRQNDTESSNNANAIDERQAHPRMNLADKFRAAAAAEKLRQQSDAASSNPVARPRAAAKMLAAIAVTKLAGAAIPWGNYEYLKNQDINALSNDKLRRHLNARGINTDDLSSKRELIDRLAESLEEERQREFERQLQLEAKHRQIADMEEQGAVYSVGKNNLGQLGLGDCNDRRYFTVVPFTRGRSCCVSTSADVTLATTENHEVLCWGGGGMGPMGIKGKYRTAYQEPQLIVGLSGEDVVETSVGANHAIAMSEGGDLFSWGNGYFGVLGSGDCKKADTPKFLDCFEKGTSVTSISCGEQHTCITTSKGSVFAWGHSSNGRLGIGTVDNRSFQPSPFQIKLPSSQVVKQVACGAEHTLVSTRSTVFSFGTGDGGRLGHGPDHSDRYEPTEVLALRGTHILDISAGTWHSAVVIDVPPFRDAGYLYTFGSGYQGQLALGKTCQISTPTLVTDFCSGQTNVKRVFCGSSHNAAITSDGNLWTWGSNKHGALGRSVEDETNMTFTPHPGIVPEFGTIVNRIGRGLPKSVACGREYTIVSTNKYDGPTEEEAFQILERRRQRDETERQRHEAVERARKEALERLRDEEKAKKKIRYLTSKRLCSIDPLCPGFTYKSSQPSICKDCGFSVVYHTIVVGEEEDDDDDEEAQTE